MKKLLLLTTLASSAMAVPSIIPQPIEMKETGGSFELKPDAVIAYADEAARPPAELLAAQLRPSTGFKLPVVAGAKGDIVFQTLEGDSLGQEGYALRITPTSPPRPPQVSSTARRLSASCFRRKSIRPKKFPWVRLAHHRRIGKSRRSRSAMFQALDGAECIWMWRATSCRKRM